MVYVFARASEAALARARARIQRSRRVWREEIRGGCAEVARNSAAILTNYIGLLHVERGIKRGSSVKRISVVVETPSRISRPLLLLVLFPPRI